MAKLRSCLSFAFFLHATCLINIATCCQAAAKSHEELARKDHVALFIFGDSYLDAGNNNYINTSTLVQANFWPYGETYFKFPTGRFSDGRLVSDFIAEYANLPLISPFLQPGIHQYLYGVNFASGGAGALVGTYPGLLSYYKKVIQKLGEDGAKITLSKAVHLFSIGTNDYNSPFLTNSTVLDSYSYSQYVGMVIGNLSTVIQEIYEAGGRKFAFMNVPPLGCLPIMRVLRPETNGSCLEQVSLLATLHNKALSKLLLELEKQLMGFKYSLFDMNSSLQQRITHPSNYGFKQGEGACCGTGEFRGIYSCGGKRTVREFELCENPNEYVFWDSVHLTQQTYKQFADQMWSSSVNGPYNLKELFQYI